MQLGVLPKKCSGKPEDKDLSRRRCEVGASCEVSSECTVMVSLISEGVCAHLYSGWPHTMLSISRDSLTFFSASLPSLLFLSHPYPPHCFFSPLFSLLLFTHNAAMLAITNSNSCSRSSWLTGQSSRDIKIPSVKEKKKVHTQKIISKSGLAFHPSPPPPPLSFS